jgi:hypothetical protein
MNFAKMSNNKVVNIEVADRTWIEAQPNKDDYIEYTSDNPASIGGDYYEEYFYPEKPYDSWQRDGQGNWISPVPKPNDEKFYSWDENTLTWIEVVLY